MKTLQDHNILKTDSNSKSKLNPRNEDLATYPNFIRLVRIINRLTEPAVPKTVGDHGQLTESKRIISSG